MDEISIDVALGCLGKTLGEMFEKHFICKKELSEYEQKLLNDLHTLVIHSQYLEVFRKHFSIKQK